MSLPRKQIDTWRRLAAKPPGSYMDEKARQFRIAVPVLLEEIASLENSINLLKALHRATGIDKDVDTC